MNIEQTKKLSQDFKKASQRVLFLDYDGTLTPLVTHHSLAKPEPKTVKLLKKLSKLPNTDLVIISGRNKETLEKWLPIPNITLIAEHGAWIKKPNQKWQLSKNITDNWKPKIIELLQKHLSNADGAFIEEKDYSIAWHYINLDPKLISEKTVPLLKELTDLITDTDLQILHGKNIIEIRNANINKGNTVTEFISQKNYNFILAAGDDLTDEDMFKALPPESHTIKVGLGDSGAKYHLANNGKVIKFLHQLSQY